ncbi:sNF2 family N-terminal domain protein [Clostridium sp. CAG:149]|nr:sNF2 family N-terminal domain protein [Clostridium sp. CAG:149]
MSGTELLKVLDAYRQKKKYYRLKNGEFLKLSDDGFMTIARLQEGLGIGKGELKEKQIVLPGYRALYLDQMVREEGGIAFYRDSLYKAVARGMKSGAGDEVGGGQRF